MRRKSFSSAFLELFQSFLLIESYLSLAASAHSSFIKMIYAGTTKHSLKLAFAHVFIWSNFGVRRDSCHLSQSVNQSVPHFEQRGGVKGGSI